MTEPITSLTDFGLALLVGLLALSLARHPAPSRLARALWVLLFGATAGAALAGGLTHGFFQEATSLGHRLLWPATLLAIGIAAACVWVLVGHLLFGTRRIRPWVALAMALWLLYGGVVLLGYQRFIVAIGFYVPAMTALLLVSARACVQGRNLAVFGKITAAIVLAFLAAIAQQKGMALHKDYCNPNATYHLLQGIGFTILFLGVKPLLAFQGRPLAGG